MQGLWHRIKRLSPYVELKETIDYNKELALEDAQEVILLLGKTRDLWDSKVIYLLKVLPTQPLQFGLYQNTLINCIHLLTVQQTISKKRSLMMI